MNKNVVAVFAAVCGLFMVSCDTPKDLRPGEKVSVDLVEPGTRNSYNVEESVQPHSAGETKQEVTPNHEQGGKAADTVNQTTETNTAAGAVRK